MSCAAALNNVDPKSAVKMLSVECGENFELEPEKYTSLTDTELLQELWSVLTLVLWDL